MHSIKLSGYVIGIKFDKQNNKATKIENICIVYDLDVWARNPTNNFKFENCLFGTTSVVKNIEKEKYVYSGYEITFDSAASWSFDNDSARNVIIFSIDNRSSSHTDNR